MCRGKIVRVTASLKSNIRWYCVQSFAAISTAIVLAVIVFAGLIPGADKMQTAIFSACIAAVSAFPLKEVFARKDKLLWIRLLDADFAIAKHGPDTLAELEKRCEQ